MKTIRVLGAVAVGCLTVAACGGSSNGTSSAQPAETAQTAPTTADPGNSNSAGDSTVDTALVPAALQFAAPLVGGGEIDARTLADKPTVFWFWAPT